MCIGLLTIFADVVRANPAPLELGGMQGGGNQMPDTLWKQCTSLSLTPKKLFDNSAGPVINEKGFRGHSVLFPRRIFGTRTGRLSPFS